MGCAEHIAEQLSRKKSVRKSPAARACVNRGIAIRAQLWPKATMGLQQAVETEGIEAEVAEEILASENTATAHLDRPVKQRGTYRRRDRSREQLAKELLGRLRPPMSAPLKP